MEGLTALVIADGLAVAQELNLAFRRHLGVTILGPAFDESSARDAISGGAVDVIVVDLERQDDLGLDLVSSMRAIAPVPVLVTAPTVDAPTVARVLAAGGSGILLRQGGADRMAEDLRAAAAGQIALTDGHLSSVVEYLYQLRAERQLPAVATLTTREHEVLALLCYGRSSGEIAAALGVSPSTVQAHIRSVLSKLGVHSQVDAIRTAWRCGIGVPVSA